MVSTISIQCLLYLTCFAAVTLEDGARETNNSHSTEDTRYKIANDPVSTSENPAMENTSIASKPSLPAVTSTSNVTDMMGLDARGFVNVFGDIHHGTVSQLTYESIEFALEIVGVPAVIIMGFIGNMAALRTLLNQRPRDSVTSYLICLSFTDTSVMISYFLSWFADVVKIYNQLLGVKIQAALFVPVLVMGEIFFTRSSAFITVILSIERAIAVKFPPKVKTIFLNQHPGKVVMALYFCALIVLLPNLFRFNVRVLTNTENNESMLAIMPTEFTKSTTFYTYYGVVYQIITRIIPMALVVTCNVIIIRGVHIFQRDRKQIVSNTQEEFNVTRLLLSISVIFVITTGPSTIFNVASRFTEEFRFYGKEHYFFLSINAFSTYLDIVNSSVNFIVYMFFSKKFRETFVQTWRCACCKT